jgi:uridine kinase/RimJ/RimL family protein N-acetyltransferase
MPSGEISRQSFAFRPLEPDDLPKLVSWFAREHVARWWEVSDDLEEKYFESGHPVRRFVALLNDQPIGMVQCYRWSDYPDDGAVIDARPGEIGIDYLIGDESLIGRGIGPLMLEAFLARFASGRGDVIGMRVDIAEANRRSWRCLEKLGVRRDQSGVSIEGEPGPHYVYVREAAGTETPSASETVMRVAQLALTSAAATGMNCRILAIDGLGGAGKSTLAARVSERLDCAPIIHTDDFASWEIQFDWHHRLLDQVLRPLSEGARAQYQRYDWNTRALAEWHELDRHDFLIIEGVGASRIAFRPYLAATVWVETGRAERLRRGLARDGDDALALWETWMQAEDDYVAREQPDRTADMTVSGED